MNPLGHVGLVAGAAYLAQVASARRGTRPGGGAVEKVANVDPVQRRGGWRIDYRLAAVGALLPDFVDKPLAFLVLPFFHHNTRTIGHTAVFGLALLLGAVLLLRFSGRSGLLVLALGSLSHLPFDGMWTSPGTLLWPLLGWSFPWAAETPGLSQIWEYLGAPARLIPDIVGLLAILYILFKARRRGLLRFIRTGTLA